VKADSVRERQVLMDSHGALVRRLHSELDNVRQTILAQKHLAREALAEVQD
jgi:hypothetical protein